jgi:hypothetical protein
VILKHFRFIDLRASLLRPATEVVRASCSYVHAASSTQLVDGSALQISARLAIAAGSTVFAQIGVMRFQTSTRPRRRPSLRLVASSPLVAI